MGLFGMRGSRAQRFSNDAVKLLREIGRELELSLKDTATEYLILQAAGIYVAIKFKSIPVEMPECSIEEAINKAQQILMNYGIKRRIDSTIRKEVDRVISVFIDAIEKKKIGVGGLIGTLDNLLDFYENESSFHN